MAKLQHPIMSKDQWEYLFRQYIFDETHLYIMRLHILHAKNPAQIARAVGFTSDYTGKLIRKYEKILFEKAKEIK